MRYIVKFAAISALFWASISIFASCAPESLLMHLLPCGSMSHESVICPMTVLASSNGVVEATVVLKDFAVFALLVLVTVAVFTRARFKKPAALLKNFCAQVFRVPILFASWLAHAFKIGLLNPKTF